MEDKNFKVKIFVVTNIHEISENFLPQKFRLYGTKRVFRCTVNDFSALILAYLVSNYKFKGISIILSEFMYF